MYTYRLTDHNWLILKLHNEIFEKISPRFKGTVADLGCGTSPYRQEILDRGLGYVGLDWYGSWHDSSGVSVFANLATALPLKESCVDTAICFQVLEHLPEPKLFIEECFRILKPGGCLYLTVPFMWHIHEEPHDYFRYTTFGLRYLLESSGFEQIEIEPTTGFWQMWLLKFNYYTRYFARRRIRFAFIPFWYATQKIAPLLDKVDPRETETAGYSLVAHRPE